VLASDGQGLNHWTHGRCACLAPKSGYHQDTALTAARGWGLMTRVGELWTHRVFYLLLHHQLTLGHHQIVFFLFMMAHCSPSAVLWAHHSQVGFQAS
jgi:hypothetical protein